jgi:hypothetical protein
MTWVISVFLAFSLMGFGTLYRNELNTEYKPLKITYNTSCPKVQYSLEHRRNIMMKKGLLSKLALQQFIIMEALRRSFQIHAGIMDRHKVYPLQAI